MLSENGSTSTRPMKRTAAAATPSPSQPAAAKEAWGTLVLQMNAEDTQTFELKEDKARLGVRGLGLGLVSGAWARATAAATAWARVSGPRRLTPKRTSYVEHKPGVAR